MITRGDDLLEALTAIEAPGSFASFAALANQPPAGLSVHDVGDIAMPLSESQALQLIAKARQAPYGKGSETLVDTSVRNTWELDADQFTFQNPRWPSYLDEILGHVAKNLGIDGAIRAEIYKMLIYEKGAMFKPHTDTEKIPGMFGTMVICLPSPHEGGEVVVKHCGQKKVFSTSKQTQSLATWYSDVTHEVLPVTSGYRWVLTYNLCHDLSQPRPTAGLPQSHTQQLHQVLSRWLSASPDTRTNSHLYHVLDHDYTQANISLQALKTQDSARVGALAQMRNQLPVSIFLALLEKSEMGSCEMDYNDRRGWRARGRGWYDDYGYDNDGGGGFHELEDIFETEYKIKTLVDLDGNVVSEGLHLDEEDILEEGCFDDIDAEEEYEGYMGNSGPTATHWYRVAAVVIVPRESLFGFFEKSGRVTYSVNNLPSQLAYLARECLLPQAPQSSVDTLAQFCQRMTMDALSGDTTEHIFKAALQHERYELFDHVFPSHAGRLPSSFLRWLRQWLRTEHCETRFNSIITGISSIISSYPYLGPQVYDISIIAPASGSPDKPPTPDFMLSWARDLLRSCLDASKLEKLGATDGAAVVDIAGYFDEPTAFIEQAVLQKLGQQSDAAPFTMGLLSRLNESNPRLTTEDCTRVSQKLAIPFAAATDFTKVCSKEAAEIRARSNRLHYASVASSEAETRTAINAQQLVEVFSIVMKLSTDEVDLTRQLISSMIKDASKFTPLDLHVMWVPFLSSLLSVLVSDNIPLGTECYQQLYSAVLKAYLDRFVTREPVPNGSLVRPRVNCSCGDCDRLNRFLASDQEVGHFAVNKKRRMRLHQRLDSARIDCTHETWRSGSPQTLVVTKTFTHHAGLHKSWKSRRKMAAEKIEEFDRGQIQELLGSDYAPIASMSRVSAKKPSRAQAAQSSGSARTRTPVAGEKRKLPFKDVEVIDLTED